MSKQQTTPRRKKMNVGNTLNCLGLASHHLEEGKLTLMFLGTPLGEIESTLRYRFRILREELKEVMDRIKHIKEIAEQHTDIPCVQKILDLLNEQFEFGHDLSED